MRLNKIVLLVFVSIAMLWPHVAGASSVLQPKQGKMLFPEMVTETAQQGKLAHDLIVLPIMSAVAIFVLVLMIYIIFRFRKSANPTPSTFTHNVTLEVIWTVVPVIILVVLAVTLLPIVKKQEEVLPADLTVKVIGRQWNWTYQYVDHGGFEFVSNELSKEEAQERGLPYKLAADYPMVVPAGKQIELLVTAAAGDVIHSFGSVRLLDKTDAIPAKINRLQFKIDEPQTIFGQCYELCGARHSNMPIQINVVPESEFNAWISEQQRLAGIEITPPVMQLSEAAAVNLSKVALEPN